MARTWNQLPRRNLKELILEDKNWADFILENACPSFRDTHLNRNGFYVSFVLVKRNNWMKRKEDPIKSPTYFIKRKKYRNLSSRKQKRSNNPNSIKWEI